MGTEPIRIAFVLTEFIVGGAEMMLWKLVSRLDRSRFTPCVIALSDESDAMLDRFMQSRVECRRVGMRSALSAPAGVLRLSAALRKFQPDLVQGWLYHANVTASFASLLACPRVPVLWSIRGAPPLPGTEKWQTRLTIRVGGKLSRFTRRIIHNSAVGAITHEQLGYSGSGRVVLPNGFDTAAFQPSARARAAVRAELGLPQSTVLVGLIGRYHPMKDHATFLRAAALTRRRHPDVHYVLAGGRIDTSNAELTNLISANGLADRVHLLGLRGDMNTITAALDLSVLSSTVEGFPNVLGEAMSCGVPCVATDVGDCASIIGDTGRTVPCGDPPALSRAIGDLLSIGAPGRAVLGDRARHRIVEEFSLDAIVRRYQELYSEVYAEGRSVQARTTPRPAPRFTPK